MTLSCAAALVPSEAVIITADGLATSEALTAKLTDVDPSGTRMLAGNEINDEVHEHEMDTWLPPVGAAVSNVMLAVAVEPAGRLAGSKTMETTRGAAWGVFV